MGDDFKILLVKKENNKKNGFDYFLLIALAGILASSLKAHEFNQSHSCYDFPILGVLNSIPFLLYFRALWMIPKNVFLRILGMFLLVIVAAIPWTWDVENFKIEDSFFSLPLWIFFVNFALSSLGLIFALFIKGENSKPPRTSERFKMD